MESWNTRALPYVYEAYLGLPACAAVEPDISGMPNGELFQLALLHFSEQRHITRLRETLVGAPRHHAPQGTGSRGLPVGFGRGRRSRA